LSLVADEIVLQGSLLLLGWFYDYCPIFLFYLVPSEHFVEACKCFGGLGKEYYARYGSVEAVYYAAEYIARLGVSLFEILSDGVYQWFVACLVALYYIGGAFVDGNYVIVFV
jgi:hypothetical protein